MRFRTRAFLICFLPFTLLLCCSFWIIQSQVQATVRGELRTALSANQTALALVRAKSSLENNRFLKIAGENAALKAGMQLLATEGNSDSARRTLEDQLRELGEHMGFDLLLVSSPQGVPLAGVVRDGSGGLTPISAEQLPSLANGLTMLGDRPYEIGSVSLDAAGDNIGGLAVGDQFELAEFAKSAVLLRDGKVIQSTVPKLRAATLEQSLRDCKNDRECDLRAGGDHWLSLPIHVASDGAYVVRSMDDVDAVAAPAMRVLHRVFFVAGWAGVAVALLCSYLSAQSIVKPIAAIVNHLRSAGRNGVLPEFTSDISAIAEVRELTGTYNHAAASVKQAREELEGAYVEFVGSLASALDARDRYTAGHSQRVSDLSCAIGKALGLPGKEIEKIRVGALLHDIGKIGIHDAVLQKPGRLSDEEFVLIQQHPVIGRRILEGVQGFAPYLPAVELHHEHWNGTGYPRQQAGDQIPMEARIIHVADAYDAMTTNRSYRRGMPREKAISVLSENAGKHFDPQIVDVFRALPEELFANTTKADDDPLQTLEAA